MKTTSAEAEAKVKRASNYILQNIWLKTFRKWIQGSHFHDSTYAKLSEPMAQSVQVSAPQVVRNITGLSLPDNL